MKTRSKVLCLILTVLMAFGMVGCGKFSPKKVAAKELTANMKVSVNSRAADDRFVSAYDDFSFEFLSRAANEENVLVSPLSAAICLSMIFNGANGETLSQFENTFGGIGIDELNEYFKKYIDETDSDKIKIADSVWLNSELDDPTEQFLKDVKSYYNSEVYKAVFDSGLVKDVNNWVYNKTNGMIKEILNDTNKRYYMYLLNALYFESEWIKQYEKSDISDRQFTNADGSVTNVQMMYSGESGYFSLGGADCFTKYYKGGRYAFVGMLPKVGEKLSDFLKGISGSEFKEAFQAREYISVDAGIPEFTYDYSIEMTDLLKDMGIVKAFTNEADFTKMRARGELNLDFVLQKTRIELDRMGTKAAAVTIGGMEATSAGPQEKKRIILDRPFAYAIVDASNGMPLFLGGVNKL